METLFTQCLAYINNKLTPQSDPNLEQQAFFILWYALLRVPYVYQEVKNASF